MPTEPARIGRADEQPHADPAEGRSTEASALPMALDAAGRGLGAVRRDLLGQAAARGT